LPSFDDRFPFGEPEMGDTMKERGSHGKEIARKGPLASEQLRRMDAWWRAANYLSVGQIYLYDNADLIVACIVGDGEAETGPLATGWHGNKFLNPARDGTVSFRTSSTSSGAAKTYRRSATGNGPRRRPRPERG